VLAADRFVQEARVVNQISHPNIVDIFHVGRLGDGRPYLVMELLRGQTLADRLADLRMSAFEAIDILLEIAAAVRAAHKVGVVHRDLKPGNIFLAEGLGAHAVVKVVDWGIAKLTTAVPAPMGMTTTGVMLGTPLYVSPEQARGRNLDARSDVYSFGVIAYEMFVGDPPFVADNVADLLSMHLRTRPVPPSDMWADIPPALERLLLAMLAKEPDGRPDLDEVMSTLQGVRAHLDARAAAPARRRLAAGSSPGNAPVVITEEEPSVTDGVELDGIFTERAQTMPIDLPPARPREARPTEPGLEDRIDDSVEVILAPMDAPARWPWLLGGMVLAAGVAVAIMLTRGGASTTATVDVQVTPAHARVVVDGKDALAIERGRAAWDVPAGRHAICIDAPGFAPYAQSLDVSGELVLHVVLAPGTGRCAAAP